VRHGHGLLSIVILTWIGSTLVKCHHDICADLALGVDDILRGEDMLRAIDVAAKLGPFLLDLPNVREGVYLIAAAVGEYRPVPADEPM
jgi:hypothetical protein